MSRVVIKPRLPRCWVCSRTLGADRVIALISDPIFDYDHEVGVHTKCVEDRSWIGQPLRLKESA